MERGAVSVETQHRHVGTLSIFQATSDNLALVSSLNFVNRIQNSDNNKLQIKTEKIDGSELIQSGHLAFTTFCVLCTETYKSREVENHLILKCRKPY